ncbi:MAG: hypothetical protein EZS28_005282 [Streblomastix strix]|uniref:Uncharacterized protein n=1 Tax=Streblomastix strix TaxID=222440 RepID=A0A5J4WYB4_9EUKA|nr:MAG: hypothetical protein EZS28_005282 [Streblomastix strix]
MKPKIHRKARKTAGNNRTLINLQVVRSLNQIFQEIRSQYKNKQMNSQHPEAERSMNTFNQQKIAEEISLLDEGIENEGLMENVDMLQISQSKQGYESSYMNHDEDETENKDGNQMMKRRMI